VTTQAEPIDHQLSVEGYLRLILQQLNQTHEMLEERFDDGLPVYLRSHFGKIACVNEAGELQVAPGDYDEPVFKELGVINTAYNFYKPSGTENFIMTGFMAYGDQQVNTATNATVIIYEASAPDTTTVDKVLAQFEIGNNQSLVFPSMRLKVNSGVYINAKTDDDDIHMTIFGHFIRT